MIGKHAVKVSDKRVRYSFELVRNITVVQGNSGTGKTTLFDMISAYTRLKERSGVQIVCDKACVALHADSDWQARLSSIHDSIVFIDEDAEYIASHAFASAIRHTDNYYVIFCRESLHELPYSVEEIYEIKTSKRLHTFKKMYLRQKDYVYAKAEGRAKPSALLTEDSHAGYQFYLHHYDGTSVVCSSAGSNSGIFSWLQAHHDEKVFVVADGAAFGSEMNRVMELQHQFPDKITLCLPECFEWLILQSGLIDIPGLDAQLESPSESINSQRYFSWENFFEEYLIQQTAGTHYAYSKSQIHRFYTVRENSSRIVALIAASMPEA